MMAVQTHDTVSVLSAIASLVQATLVVHGDSDLVVPLANGVALHRGIGNSELFVMPGVGHVYVIRDVMAGLTNWSVGSGRWTAAKAREKLPRSSAATRWQGSKFCVTASQITWPHYSAKGAHTCIIHGYK